MVARNKQNFTTLVQCRYCKGIYSNLDYIYSLPDELVFGEMWEFTIQTEPLVHAYTKREFKCLYVTRIFLATAAHFHDRAAIKIHITHFTRIFNDHLIL